MPSIIITSCIHHVSSFGIKCEMQRIVRTEREEPMRSWDSKRCFVRNENGNMIPGEKGLGGNMVTHSFQNMKNKFTLKKKKKNGSDRFILSLYIRDMGCQVFWKLLGNMDSEQWEWVDLMSGLPTEMVLTFTPLPGWPCQENYSVSP